MFLFQRNRDFGLSVCEVLFRIVVCRVSSEGGTLVRLVSRPTVHLLWNSLFGDDDPVKLTRSCERPERSEGLGFFQDYKDLFSASGSGTAYLHIDHADTSICKYIPNIQLITNHLSQQFRKSRSIAFKEFSPPSLSRRGNGLEKFEQLQTEITI